MNITRADAERLALRAAAPVKEGFYRGTLCVFVPGQVRNPLNGSHGHWSKHRKWASDWRERTTHRLWAFSQWIDLKLWAPKVPKVIAFAIYSRNPFDSDNRAAVCKPLRDALKDARLIDDDRDSSGHSFSYGQVIARHKGAVHGIAIDIRLRDT